MQRHPMSKLNRLIEQRNAIEARIKEEDKKLRDRERKRDTRRKVLTGATALEWAKEDSEFSARLYARMNAFLVRDKDRTLFNFAPVLRTEDARAGI